MKPYFWMNVCIYICTLMYDLYRRFHKNVLQNYLLPSSTSTWVHSQQWLFHHYYHKSNYKGDWLIKKGFESISTKTNNNLFFWEFVSFFYFKSTGTLLQLFINFWRQWSWDICNDRILWLPGRNYIFSMSDKLALYNDINGLMKKQFSVSCSLAWQDMSNRTKEKKFLRTIS